MASYINMSLDDIIQKKRKENSRNTNKIKKQSPAKKANVIDARFKIISKKRTQITDAREKLAELAKHKDARMRLDQMRAKRHTLGKPQGSRISQNPGKFVRPYYKKERVFTDPSRHVVSQPLNVVKALRTQASQNRKFMENRSIGTKSLSKTALKPIIRTIKNDLEIIDDSMECESMKSTSLNRKASLQLKIVTNNSNERTKMIVREKSPPRPPSILKKRPMAALRNEQKEEESEKPVLEFRIIVSNLRNTVTGGDIEELFGDVGGMSESRLVRPGTAEVIYKSVEDAQKAVDLYHNRQLDGQPMNCLLVTPRTNSSVPRSSTKPALYSTNSNVEPDISTFHKVLFSNF